MLPDEMNEELPASDDDAASVAAAFTVPPVVAIDPLSVTSLYLKLYSHAGAVRHLGNATGFVVDYGGKHYLLTNWHVLAGRHAETGKPLHPTAALPDQVRIAHMIGQTGKIKWMFVRESLLNPDGTPRWVEHPLGSQVDVAALELKATPANATIRPLSLALADSALELYPSMPVSIIGFPGGLRANWFFAIWKTGHIASDPEIPYQGLPAFLIDATTRGGMSGSIVVARAPIAPFELGGATVWVPPRTKFLGVYASRLPGDVEIGCVWRPSAIVEVLQRAAAATARGDHHAT
jgi:hypothetical protein